MPPACLVVLLLLTACRRPDGDPDIGAYHAVSLDGSEVSLRDLRGQVVLFNVWSLWCLPCRSEMPALERLHRAYQPAGLTLIGVNVDARGDIPTVRNFVRTTGLTYRIWLDPDDGVSAHFPTPSLPASWLIGRDGRMEPPRHGPSRRSRARHRVAERARRRAARGRPVSRIRRCGPRRRQDVRHAAGGSRAPAGGYRRGRPRGRDARRAETAALLRGEAPTPATVALGLPEASDVPRWAEHAAAMAELPCARMLVLDAPTRLGRALDALSPR